MKYCSKCKRHLRKDKFAKHKRDGLQNWCRSCMNKESTRSRQQPERRKKRSRQEHKRISMRNYGLTSDEYDAIIGDGKCEVCGSDERITIDHNHSTGKVRGRLCSHCNIALGHIKDNPKTARGLAVYLERT